MNFNKCTTNHCKQTEWPSAEARLCLNRESTAQEGLERKANRYLVVRLLGATRPPHAWPRANCDAARAKTLVSAQTPSCAHHKSEHVDGLGGPPSRAAHTELGTHPHKSSTHGAGAFGAAPTQHALVGPECAIVGGLKALDSNTHAHGHAGLLTARRAVLRPDSASLRSYTPRQKFPRPPVHPRWPQRVQGLVM